MKVLLRAGRTNMVLRKCRAFQPAISVVLTGALLVLPVAAQNLQSIQERNVVPTAGGLAEIRGGTVKGIAARTQTFPTLSDETASWVSLPDAVLTRSVPPNTTDVFDVSFSAECRLGNSSSEDHVRIRVLDTVNGVSTPLEPYDGAQAFCAVDGYATHKGNWVNKVGGGMHTLQVQFWIFDGSPLNALTATIDDWTFKLVVHD